MQLISAIWVHNRRRIGQTINKSAAGGTPLLLQLNWLLFELVVTAALFITPVYYVLIFVAGKNLYFLARSFIIVLYVLSA